MKTAIRTTEVDRVKTPLLAVATAKLGRRLPRELNALDRATGGAIERAVAAGDFTGERDQRAVLHPRRGPRRLVLIGLGSQSEVSRTALRRGAAIAARAAVGTKVSSMAFRFVASTKEQIGPEEVAQVVTEGVAQGAWQFTDYKGSDARGKPIERLDLIVDRSQRAAAEQGRAVGTAIAEAQQWTRTLQALPGNVCTPTYLGNVAKQLGKTTGIKVTVLTRAQIERNGMEALLAVSQGSAQDPRFIVLEHRGAGNEPPLCFVGKGVTFDSGGISIKPALHMEEMKYDMSGAAAVLGLFHALGQLKPAANVVGLIPTTENLPSGTAVKPGDVIGSHLGKSIEVINTDAEGRLILADALSYASRYEPACVIDAATLTGAVVVGLGYHASGLMGNDDRLIEEVRRAGELAGERCWPLPLWDDYRSQIDSDVADIKNTGGRAAGSITAGWFLREFVGDFPWVHLDIAGTAYTDTNRPDLPKGPTGVGVRLFTHFVLERAKA